MRAWRTGPVPSVVSLDEVKRNARVLHEDEDLLIQSLIDAAHTRVEEETARVFGVGEWVIEADFACERLVSSIWPVTAVPAGWLIEPTGRTVTLVAGTWPEDRRIVVTAGEDMPPTVRQAVILLATHWYESRAVTAAEAKGEMPYAVTALLGLARRMFA